MWLRDSSLVAVTRVAGHRRHRQRRRPGPRGARERRARHDDAARARATSCDDAVAPYPLGRRPARPDRLPAHAAASRCSSTGRSPRSTSTATRMSPVTGSGIVLTRRGRRPRPADVPLDAPARRARASPTAKTRPRSPSRPPRPSRSCARPSGCGGRPRADADLRDGPALIFGSGDDARREVGRRRPRAGRAEAAGRDLSRPPHPRARGRRRPRSGRRTRRPTRTLNLRVRIAQLSIRVETSRILQRPCRRSLPLTSGRNPRNVPQSAPQRAC